MFKRMFSQFKNKSLESYKFQVFITCLNSAANVVEQVCRRLGSLLTVMWTFRFCWLNKWLE